MVSLNNRGEGLIFEEKDLIKGMDGGESDVISNNKGRVRHSSNTSKGEWWKV